MAQNGALTAKQKKAIQALLSERDQSAAATKSGVSRRTMVRWVHDPVFLAELRRAESEAMDGIIRRLVASADKAVTILDACLDGNGTGVQARSADIILGRLMTLKELHDIDARLSALEAANER